MNDSLKSISLLAAIRTSLQARAILDLIAQERVANSRLLHTWLATIGLPASSRSMADLLSALEIGRIIRLEQIDAYSVIRIRRFGGEVASGLEVVDWIDSPQLPE